VEVEAKPTGGHARRRPARFSATKFATPAAAAWRVPRRELLARLDAGSGATLRMVVGSPGSGKTSLLAEWSRAQPAGTAVWLNADAADRDPVRFWQGIIEGLRGVVPSFAEETYDLLTLDGAVDADALESFLGACADLDHDVDVVVDDFQLVSPAVHDHLRFLASRDLASLHLTIGTRSEPPIGLERLRLADRLCEIRDADLRLSIDEVALLLRSLAVEVDRDDLELLQDRTEGWVAGVQLAAIAMRDSDEPKAFLRRFAGTSQVVSQYLSAELLDSQVPAVRRFLLDTCVVDELTSNLAAVLSPGTGVTLADIEAANLLITRLDAASGSFRYHHLFAELLRHHLRATEPDRERELHRGAADWYERRGDLTLAFRHRWRAGAQTEAMGLIHGHVLREYLAGHVPQVSDVGRSLTDADLRAAPGPSVSYCSALVLEGLPEAAEQLIARVEAAVGNRLTPPERVQLAGTGVVASGILGDIATVITDGQAVLDLAAANGVHTEWVDVVRMMLLRASAWEELFALAEPLVADVDLEDSDPLQSIELRTAVAQLRWQEGRLREARDLVEGSVAAVEGRGVTDANVGLAPRAVLGTVLLELDRVKDAEVELRAASASESVVRAPMIMLARCGLARIWRAEGKFDAALLALDDARRVVRRPTPGTAFVSHVDLARANILIDLGELAEAEHLIGGAREGPAQLIAAARLDTARGHFDRASVALEKLGTDEGPTRQRLAVAIGQLAVACAAGDPTDEAASLVLDLAEPEGFVFLIPEAGAAVLDAACHVGRRRPRTPYLDQLLVTRPHAVPVGNATIEYAIDALSERERVVLRYLVTAMSYREIADELYVSVNTIKTHVKNIIRKLQAESRADAITRARALHYL